MKQDSPQQHHIVTKELAVKDTIDWDETRNIYRELYYLKAQHQLKSYSPSMEQT